MKTIKFILFACLLSVTTSCNNWLNVDMEDGIMENTLYETNDGYLASLNGIYTKMNEVYSSTLSMGVIDAMAQYYSIAQNSQHDYYKYATYDYSQSGFESTSGTVWTTLYNLIANINTLLDHCDENGAAIKKSYYPIVKGEALALRAMFHLDLLRLYGPIYSEATASTQAIPYSDSSSKEIRPILSAKSVIDKVILDLNSASELLKDDSIRTKGVMDSNPTNPNESINLRYRQYRMNYFAVRGLLARAYLWMGDKQKAYDVAKDMITENVKNNVFAWTSKAAVQNATTPDRLFSTEVMFGLYNLKRVNMYDAIFKETAAVSQCLVFPGKELDSDDSKLLTFYSDKDDLRRGTNMWSAAELQETNSNTGVVTTQKALCFNKYADISTNIHYRYMIPLLRMSEIYLIAAECTSDKKEAIDYINSIRKARNCVDITLKDTDTDATILGYITAEFAREVIGEGQLFYYYKRHAMQQIASGTSAIDKYNMTLSKYVWPLPKVEIDKRVTE